MHQIHSNNFASDEHRTDHTITISPPEQWTGESMHKNCEIHNQKCHNNNDVNLASLQIRSTPVDAGIPSPATLLFNRPIRSLLPQMNREPINIKNYNAYYEALKIMTVNTLRQ